MTIPFIDVLIITQDRPEDTVEAAQSALTQEGVDVRVLIWVQGSQSSSVAFIQEFADQHERVQVWISDENLGVPSGRNRVAEKGSAPYLFFLDSDAELEDPTTLAQAINWLDKDPTLGVITFRILNATTQQLDEGSWVHFPRKLSDVQEPFYCRQFVGCAFLLRRAHFEQLNCFDDRLFYLLEELDFSLRAINAGYKIQYVPQFTVQHKITPQHRHSWGGDLMYYFTRNRWFIQYKYGASSLKLFATAIASLVKGARKGRLRLAWKGLKDARQFAKDYRCSLEDKTYDTVTPEAQAYLKQYHPVHGWLYRLWRELTDPIGK